MHFSRADDGAADGEAPDLYVTRVQDLDGLDPWAAPVIASGPPALLRSAFLAGCADYLREPWTPEELELRALAVLARAARKYELPWGTVAFEGKNLRTPAGLVPLTLRESKILRLLLRARGEPVPRAALAGEVWGSPGRAAGRAIDVHVASVRRKVRRVQREAGAFIVCIRGAGYMIP